MKRASLDVCARNETMPTSDSEIEISKLPFASVCPAPMTERPSVIVTCTPAALG